MKILKKNYISGNGTFLYFRKQKLYKTSYISVSNFPSSKSKNNPLKKCFIFHPQPSKLIPKKNS